MFLRKQMNTENFKTREMKPYWKFFFKLQKFFLASRNFFNAFYSFFYNTETAYQMRQKILRSCFSFYFLRIFVRISFNLISWGFL